MREESALRVMSPPRGMRADHLQVPGGPSRLNPSLRSVASASARVGHLVRQAMTFFETNREAAWRCLREASTLLGAEPKESGIGAPTLQSTFRPGGLATWQAKRALEYIEANLGSKIAIEEMANVVALSKSHFSRAFKHRVGSSPMAYVAVRRVERAKLMMGSTTERLTDIALACGFADQSHLNRYFRRVVGMSPGLWRRMSQYGTQASPTSQPADQPPSWPT
jgi:AraC family transcriptional regulator